MLLSLGSPLMFSLLVPMSDVGALSVIPKHTGQPGLWPALMAGGLQDSSFYLDFLSSGWQDIVLIIGLCGLSTKH